jgi:hypothetical protein
MSDQLVVDAAVKTIDELSMPSVGFEPAILAIKRLQTYYALDRTATGIGFRILMISNY